MAGRKPKLTVIGDESGFKKSKEEMEARKKAQPNGCVDDLTPPEHLSAVAREEWMRVVELYRQLDNTIINNLDISTLTAYCECVAVYRDAQEKRETLPLISYDDKGRVVENPYLAIMRKEGLNILRYSEQLCLTPVGRARMGMATVKGKKEQSAMEEWLSRKKQQG